jgi:phospholipid/cholesterol/gamma-HCH transport system substrate-binding protein
VVFAHYLGVLNPFSNADELNVTYNFAGGIEVGSPVRVMGVKVGKVKEMHFDPDMKDENGNEVKLRIKISISKKAWSTVRKDSKFFINLAGVIGEKFLEISPGSMTEPALKPNDTVRGEDPPRIDQLISQSYGLAGKVIDFMERNEGTVTNTIDRLDGLLKNLNKTLVLLEKVTDDRDIQRLGKNIVKISDDVAKLTGKLTTDEADKTYDLMHKLVWRLEDLDAKTIKRVLQEEGIKAKIF